MVSDLQGTVQTYQTEFSGNIAGPISWIVENNTSQISVPDPYTPFGGSITYNFTCWADNFSTQNSRTITPDNNENYTALYKIKDKTNNAYAIKNNNEQHIIRSNSGHLHKV